jgi:hypothetical protein
MRHGGGGSSSNDKKRNLPHPGPSQCHPRVGKDAAAHGCVPLETLRSVAQKLSLENASGSDGTELRKKILEKLEMRDEKPVGERTFVMALPLPNEEKERIVKKYLRPAAPDAWKSDPDAWLDSLNIAHVLNQYEEAYPHFEFMGPFPIDFAAPDPYSKQKGGEDTDGGSGSKKCLMNEICELRVKEALSNGTKAIGIVYNLDPHYKSGSHWVANYIDIPGHRCYYFDSYGVKPPKQVEAFMKWLTTQDPEMRLEYNARRLQYKNTECGVYCLYFIIRMLEGDRFADITRRDPTDADMLDLRDWLFST